MMPSKMLRLAAGAVCAALLVSQGAQAAPAPAPAAATTRPPLTPAQLQAMAQAAAQSLAADVAAKRQALAQQAAQRHQTQLTALRAALPTNVQTLSGARLGAVPSALASGAALKPLAPMGTLSLLSKSTSTNPVIQQISVTEGDPGTPVLLTGDGFGDTAGEVHFIVASGKDLKATNTPIWSNGQIVAEVPYLDGVNAYDGFLYVQRLDGTKTGVTRFKFRPPLDVVVLGIPTCVNEHLVRWHNYDRYLCDHYADSVVAVDSDYAYGPHDIDRGTWLFSYNANDEFYITTRLKSGWFVSSCDAYVDNNYSSGRFTVAVSDCRVGTNSPYTKLHWWIDGGNTYVSYAPRVTITGPKGLPYL